MSRQRWYRLWPDMRVTYRHADEAMRAADPKPVLERLEGEYGRAYRNLVERQINRGRSGALRPSGGAGAERE